MPLRTELAVTARFNIINQALIDLLNQETELNAVDRTILTHIQILKLDFELDRLKIQQAKVTLRLEELKWCLQIT